ncbi:MAG: O-antigen ligase domain-containing protein, partial [Bacteroidota bacterium]
MTSEQNIRFARRTATVLAVILCFKIAGYFTVHESIVITRAIKILLRVSMTGWLILVYRSLVQRGNPAGFASHHLLSPWLYSVYLFLGLASLLYSTNPGYSLLQLTMNLE